jgi:hypothetical protein
MKRPVTPSLSSVMRLAIDNAMMDMHVALPCRVETYDETAQTANLKPMIKRSIKKQDGTVQHESLPVIPNVPIAMPRFGNWFLSAPIAKGDFMFIVCSERNIDIWREKGTETESGELGTHTLDGAVAFPCNLYPTDQALSSAHASNMVLGKDDGAQIHIKPDGEIHIYEENADQYVALAQKVFDEIDALRSTVNSLVSDYNSHSHGGVPDPAPQASGPAAVNSVAATKVKAT